MLIMIKNKVIIGQRHITFEAASEKQVEELSGYISKMKVSQYIIVGMPLAQGYIFMKSLFLDNFNVVRKFPYSEYILNFFLCNLISFGLLYHQLRLKLLSKCNFHFEL